MPLLETEIQSKWRQLEDSKKITVGLKNIFPEWRHNKDIFGASKTWEFTSIWHSGKNIQKG